MNHRISKAAKSAEAKADTPFMIRANFRRGGCLLISLKSSILMVFDRAEGLRNGAVESYWPYRY